MNTFYDILSKNYLKIAFQPKHQADERQSLCNMVDQMKFPEPTIVLADRGYESFNVFEHLKQAGQKFLIRAKDVNSNGFLSHLTLPQTPTFDVIVDFKLTRRQTKAISMVRS
ncbi:transposase [Lactobacillus kimbladii]|uniref:transposase n=1 Tax=Lactobacillus kimbladii TaxID=1218506 RepID=UPI00061A9C36|nr:transposase [Lactobacillus kimbladii]